ncbi:uncharacterized protein LOC143249473 [Tachypleus tridentatus]|uniref:uncharacterized protein LOC143249473 n=1 Tax=Tachypleus tridentatus TaxID=6853 RepID=UPI003FD42C6A
MERCQTFKLDLLKSKYCGLLSEEDGPPPLEWDGPPQLEWYGPPQLEWYGPVSLDVDEPPPLEFVDTSFLGTSYQPERCCQKPVEYRQNNVRTSVKQRYHHILSQPMYVPVPSSTLYSNIVEVGSVEFDESSSISSYLRSNDHRVYALVFVANFSYGTCQKEIMKLFEMFNPLDVKMIITEPTGTGEFTQALVLLPSPEGAEAAEMKLNNTVFKKRRIVVSTKERDIERAFGLLEQNNYSGK